ncbi:MAG: alpha/beta hydrolase [Pseudomonadota bacterium]
MVTARLSDYRVLVAPGLYNSDAGHWQSRWQHKYPAFERVEQDDWARPDLAAWSARLDQARGADPRATLIVAHSFGCLAAVDSVVRERRGVAGLLLVAPADPGRFGLEQVLPRQALPCPSIVISSSDDPWMAIEHARLWASRWHSEFVEAGALGHINAASGLGDWAFGLDRLAALLERADQARRAP